MGQVTALPQKRTRTMLCGKQERLVAFMNGK